MLAAHENTQKLESSLSTAFGDLDALMSKAAEMVQLLLSFFTSRFHFILLLEEVECNRDCSSDISLCLGRPV